MKETNAPRFFVEPAHIGNDLVRITGPDVIHITRVLRLRRGSIVVLLDGKGKSYEAEIQSPGRDEVVCRIKKELLTASACPVQVTLVQGIPKGDKMDIIIQKGTELGVSRVIPLISRRSVVKLDADRMRRKGERWQRIAMEAAKQCRRPDVPEVSDAADLGQILASLPGKCVALMPWEEECQVSLKDVIYKHNTGEEIYVFIGPEGGFTPGEVEQARASGVRSVTLGPRILRTETAGMAVLAMILCRWGDLGGETNDKEEGSGIHLGV
ncbi:MAG: 16S rRNA (uracil(1498)-N(3))-methyltransferase [Desulfotomaculaceae bacterium]|nr:16S rRNA (uracil(1498)-N(3))-methyltransferase [Desulfotomaculaceae bacterium]MDD4766522.1 16S rRNA (uracil(1498)-N(3))-methyltransferase [Desulfotomaculaceae bacterium]